MTLRDAAKVLKDSGAKFWDDNGPRLGAALAFYTALSLSPLLIAVVAIVGSVFGAEAARGELVEQLRDTTGEQAAVVIEQLVAKSAAGGEGVAATVVAFAVALFGASNLFAELRNALNVIWHVPGSERPGGAIAFLRGRLLAFALVGGAALLLVASLLLGAVLGAMEGRVSGYVPGWLNYGRVLNVLVPFVLTTLLFAMIFKVLPDVRLAWSDVWLGALVTAALFAGGRYLIGLYLGRAAVGSAYGAAGTFVALLVWVYYSTQILLFGAELTFVYAQRHGHGLNRPRLAPA
ncbi:Ribonuclease BN OS=Cystobacter fuscus DSM 2262 GN=D187_008324 PE=4 SV=1: Virul_fac_BrkB [Gemmataceae bacterium]|nr:Ribonuclease BN OS=Cystobacter fuscus DSM 2262 GN=D187_008324 PE=4 SV=1: Virul_fac_BrkB [Gemmataceae bacterium]VTT97808.1 Ribonuclease BN OS=Cystobacter fuscus DSM 2262 GN=D187_008324 PE=4 SV=1: Virul_fac_BrkB [Gemmataceae bacterium]